MRSFANQWNAFLEDAWSPEARAAAAQARGHLHVSAHPEGGGSKGFTARAFSHSEVEKHLSNLHQHIKSRGLGAHNVTVHNTNTHEVHSAKVSPVIGVHKRSYSAASF